MSKQRTVFMRMAATIFAALLMVAALSLTACKDNSSQAQDTSGDSKTQSNTPTEITEPETPLDAGNYNFEYEDRDKDAAYDANSATVVTLSGTSARVEGAADLSSVGITQDNGVIKLTKEGTYVVRGSLSDATLSVEADDDAAVQVVFDGVEITNSNGPAFLVDSAEKVFVTLSANSTNTLSDGTGRTDIEAGADDSSTSDTASTEDSSEETATDESSSDKSQRDATLFSQADLTINGSGELSVSSTDVDAIASDGELVICGASLDIDAGNDAMKGEDCVKIADGTFTIKAGDDAITSTNVDEPLTCGFVGIDGGSFEIEAIGKAVQAETVLRLNGGDMNISKCEEGFEGVQVYIRDGDYSIVATDDAVNAAGDVSTDYLLDISGGTLTLDAEGDGMDSNGRIVQSGGTVVIDGPTQQGNGAFDADQDTTISGGSLLATSAGGMEQNYGSGSTQPSIIISLGKTYPAGTAIALVDKQGNELFAHTAKKTLSALNYSAPELKQDAEYVLKIDGTDAISFTLSEAQATVSADGSVKSSTSGGMGGPGGARGDWGANGDGTMPTPPTDGTMPARPTDGTMPTPPADGTMPDFPEDGTMPAPPTDGSIPTPPTDGTMPDPRSDRGNTGTPPSSTESQNGSEQDVTQDNIQV